MKKQLKAIALLLGSVLLCGCAAASAEDQEFGYELADYSEIK